MAKAMNSLIDDSRGRLGRNVWRNWLLSPRLTQTFCVSHEYSEPSDAIPLMSGKLDGPSVQLSDIAHDATRFFDGVVIRQIASMTVHRARVSLRLAPQDSNSLQLSQ